MAFLKQGAWLLLAIVWMQCKQTADHVALDPATLNSFISDVYHTYPIPGLAVGVVTEDTSYFLSLGYSNLAEKTPISDSTVFFAGGFSELLVATAAIALQEKGDLSLQDPVVKHLPHFKTQGPFEKITIHHLLSHTSGIPHFSPTWDMPSFEENALDATTRSIIYQKLEFTPGKRRKASPYNYDIAANLMASGESRSFEQVVSDQVFSPFQMSASTFLLKEVPEQHLASPHRVSDWLSYDLTLHEPYPYTRENAGSFGLHTTVKDLAKWMNVVLRNEEGLWSEASTRELVRRRYQTGEETFKGYGWDIVKTDRGYVYNNRWSIGGFSGDLSLFPDQKTGIVVIANASDDFNPTIISEHIAHHLSGGRLAPVKTPAHIAMSRQLAAGKELKAVLCWYDSLLASQDHSFIINASVLGQFGVNLLHRLSRREDALEVFRYCVEKYPESAEAHLNLTEGLLASGRIEDAEAHFSRALSLTDQASSPYINFLREQLTVAVENRSSS